MKNGSKQTMAIREIIRMKSFKKKANIVLKLIRYIFAFAPVVDSRVNRSISVTVPHFIGLSLRQSVLLHNFGSSVRELSSHNNSTLRGFSFVFNISLSNCRLLLRSLTILYNFYINAKIVRQWLHFWCCYEAEELCNKKKAFAKETKPEYTYCNMAWV